MTICDCWGTQFEAGFKSSFVRAWHIWHSVWKVLKPSSMASLAMMRRHTDSTDNRKERTNIFDWVGQHQALKQQNGQNGHERKHLNLLDNLGFATSLMNTTRHYMSSKLRRLYQCLHEQRHAICALGCVHGHKTSKFLIWSTRSLPRASLQEAYVKPAIRAKYNASEYSRLLEYLDLLESWTW